MLKPWRRHLKACSHTDQNYLKCKCPLWVMGTHNGEFLRRSLDTRNLERAHELIREIEMGKVVRMPIGDACDRFIAQGEANGLSKDTLNKYRLLKREFTAFFGTKDLQAITLDELARFR